MNKLSKFTWSSLLYSILNLNFKSTTRGPGKHGSTQSLSSPDFVVLPYPYCTALLVGGSRDRSLVVSGIFSETTDGTMCPGVDSASKNEPVRKGDDLTTFIVPNVETIQEP